jgi:hypothetical protein
MEKPIGTSFFLYSVPLVFLPLRKWKNVVSDGRKSVKHRLRFIGPVFPGHFTVGGSCPTDGSISPTVRLVAGTPVLMAGGGIEPIEESRSGDTR